MYDASRRAFLATSGAAAAVWLGTDPMAFARAVAAARAAARNPSQQRFDVLTPEQAADVEAFAGQIVPTDEFPGAREARAVAFIDRSLGTFAKDQLPSLVEGLDDLNRRAAEMWPGAGRFAALSAERQLELLRSIEDTPFFGQMWFATLVGTFGNPSLGGNHDGAGWRAIGFDPRFNWQPPFGAYDAEVTEGR